ncbi:unnamed protein product, partial [Sphagnum compactum]
PMFMDDNSSSSSSSSSIVGHSSSYIANEHNMVGRPKPSLGFDSFTFQVSCSSLEQVGSSGTALSSTVQGSSMLSPGSKGSVTTGDQEPSF